MEIDKKYQESLKLLNITAKISDSVLEKLLENCCRSLSGENEAYDIEQSNTSEIKNLYASLLYIYTQYVRNSQSKEEFSNFLSTECSLDKDRIKLLGDFYDKWNKNIRIQLLNIGSHLPHVTDINWKIDYIVKSKVLDQSEGPLFRVSLKTEKYDEKTQGVKTEFIEFSCTSQELQDLVYKLKDAVRHCQKLASEH